MNSYTAISGTRQYQSVSNGGSNAAMDRKGIYLTDNRPSFISQSIVNLKKSDSSCSVIQREKIKVTVIGITHLVIAKGNSIYRGQEYIELSEGNEIEIDTDQKLRSRRGPNQETFQDKDQGNKHVYRWFKVISVGGKMAPENTYIRDDTFHTDDRSKLGQRESVIEPDTQRERQSLTGAVSLRDRYPQETYPQLYRNGLIDMFESIQMLLKNKGAVHYALLHLEKAARSYINGKDILRPTQALNLALHDSEKNWMGDGFIDLRKIAMPEKQRKSSKPQRPNEKRERIVQKEDARAFQEQFLSNVVQRVLPFKDVGAPVNHGEYAHRIQWYIIAFYYLENWGKQALKALYREAGQLPYNLVLNFPVRADDTYRSLWDRVLDLRRKEAAEVVTDTAVAYAASPVMISSDLLGYTVPEKSPPKAGALVKKYPVIAHAVANRRRKRALEIKKYEKKEKLSEQENAQLDPETGWAEREGWLQQSMKDDFTEDFTPQKK